MTVYDKILFDSGGHTGKTYYVRHVEANDNTIFNTLTGELSLSTSWSDSITELVENGVTGQYPIPIPALLPTGHLYAVLIYEQVGSDPSNTDNIQDTYNVQRGSIFGF